MFYKKAFTLAEVLTTLMVIGVVAAITIPSMMNSYKERETVSKLLKIHSLLNQAHKMAVIDNGESSTWNLVNFSENSIVETASYYEPHLKIAKRCHGEQGCWPEDAYALSGVLAADQDIEFDKKHSVNYVLSDGTLLALDFYSNNNFQLQNVKYPSLIFKVDLNGLKKPNTYGKDIFGFALSNNNDIIPAGGLVENGVVSTCSKTHTSSYSGFGCAYKVLKERAINY